jgi:hypothetical protein
VSELMDRAGALPLLMDCYLEVAGGQGSPKERDSQRGSLDTAADSDRQERR